MSGIGLNNSAKPGGVGVGLGNSPNGGLGNSAKPAGIGIGGSPGGGVGLNSSIGSNSPGGLSRQGTMGPGMTKIVNAVGLGNKPGGVGIGIGLNNRSSGVGIGLRPGGVGIGLGRGNTLN